MLGYHKLSCILYHNSALYHHTSSRVFHDRNFTLWLCLLTCSLCLGIFLSDVREKVYDSSRVAPLVIVPGHHLDEVVVQSNACLDVNNRRVVIAVQVGRDNVVMGDG